MTAQISTIKVLKDAKVRVLWTCILQSGQGVALPTVDTSSLSLKDCVFFREKSPLLLLSQAFLLTA